MPAPKTWTIRFPWHKCPHCGGTIATAYYGGRFKFWAVGAGRRRKPKQPFGDEPTPPPLPEIPPGVSIEYSKGAKRDHA
jgi:hypothetical protein